MTDEEKRVFLQCLFSAAWVDGSIGESEQAILATLYNNVELPPDDRDVVDAWFETPPPEPDWLRAARDPKLRRTLFKQVYLIAASDGNVDLAEFGMLDRLRGKLDLSDEEFSTIASEIEQIVGGG